MIPVLTKWPGFCLSRAIARVRVSSPPQQYKKTYSSKKADHTTDFSSDSYSDLVNLTKPESEFGNRVMVVIDSSLEAEVALQWALSHTLQNQDAIILLHVIKPSIKCGSSNGELNQRAYELLCSMKDICQMRKPGVHVEIAVREGKDKGAIIVEEAKQQRVSLLVLGQRNPSVMWRIGIIWAGKRSRRRAAEYCIQNATCMTIVVRRKSRKYGGYLITTKRHKDFWLLA